MRPRLTLARVGLALGIAGGGAAWLATHVHAQAFDDGCAPTQIGEVQPGWDYEEGVWYDALGRVVGWAREEDECINPMTDDLWQPPVVAPNPQPAPKGALPTTL